MTSSSASAPADAAIRARIEQWVRPEIRARIHEPMIARVARVSHYDAGTMKERL